VDDSGLEQLRNLSVARNRVRYVHPSAFGGSDDDDGCALRRTENNSSAVEERPTVATEKATTSLASGDAGWSDESSLENLDLSYNLLRSVPCWGDETVPERRQPAAEYDFPASVPVLPGSRKTFTSDLGAGFRAGERRRKVLRTSSSTATRCVT